jgi:hypothetical protein
MLEITKRGNQKGQSREAGKTEHTLLFLFTYTIIAQSKSLIHQLQTAIGVKSLML